MAHLHYTISPHSRDAHLFEVTLEISQPAKGAQIVSLPRWIPGSYLMREFARHIISLSAVDSRGAALAVEKTGMSSWRVATGKGATRLSYRVYAFDLSVRTAYLDQTRGFFNGSSVFLAVSGQEMHPHQVTILSGDCPNGWKVATTLPRTHGKRWGFGEFCADNYDALVDHPVELGEFDVVKFKACGVPHAVILSGRHQADLKRLARDLKAICETQIRFFGEPAPFSEYLFLTAVVGDGYGGLEHRDSTALICSRGDLPLPDDASTSAGYRQFLGLSSHEYFHSWNVKRIKPAAFAPYQLDKENPTRLLWAFEGLTSYYDDLMLVRSGLTDPATYLQQLGETITSVWRTPGQRWQSLEDASFDAWTKYYRQDENSPNSLVSYYTQGSLVGLALDLTIRTRTNNQKSLDTVMLALWEQFGRHWDKRGEGISETAWERIACDATGLDLRADFQRWLREPGVPELAPLLATIGVEWQNRPPQSASDKGGSWVEQPKAGNAFLGARHTTDNGQIRITHVLNDSPAEQAGLAAGDILVALDGLRLTPANLESRLQSYPVGSRVTLHRFRRDELLTSKLPIKTNIQPTIALRLTAGKPHPILADWLGLATND